MYGKTLKPRSKVSIKQLRTELPDAIEKDVGEAVFGKYAKEIGELQELLFAAGTHALLVIFQGMDTSGKDGATKAVFREVNPSGCRVVPSVSRPRKSWRTTSSGASIRRPRLGARSSSSTGHSMRTCSWFASMTSPQRRSWRSAMSRSTPSRSC